MDNHATELCRKCIQAEHETFTGDRNTSRKVERTWPQISHPESFKSKWIDFKPACDQCNQVNNGTALLPTATDCKPFWLADNATPLIAASALAAWVIDSGASHSMCNDCTRLNSIQKQYQPIVIEPGADNQATARYHRLVKISQEYDINALYTPTFWFSFLSINPFDTAGVSNGFGQSLRVLVLVGTELYSNWCARSSIHLNRQFGYISMDISQPFWIRRIVSWVSSRFNVRFI